MAEWRQGSRCRKLRTPILNDKNEAESNLKVVGVFLTLKTLFNSSNKVTAPPTRDQAFNCPRLWGTFRSDHRNDHSGAIYIRP